jgi:hypothetical protein
MFLLRFLFFRGLILQLESTLRFKDQRSKTVSVGVRFLKVALEAVFF